jgi:hypothetical protein
MINQRLCRPALPEGPAATSDGGHARDARDLKRMGAASLASARARARATKLANCVISPGRDGAIAL